MKPYYEAYDDRYKTIHQLGLSWSSDIATPIVLQVADRYRPSQIFEIGCGEGRDARAVLDAGYRLLAADVSPEAIRYCKNAMPQYADCFICMDCLCDNPDAEEKWYDMIYSVKSKREAPDNGNPDKTTSQGLLCSKPRLTVCLRFYRGLIINRGLRQ